MDRHNYVSLVSFQNLSKRCSDITYRNKKCHLVIPRPRKCLPSPDSNHVPSLDQGVLKLFLQSGPAFNSGFSGGKSACLGTGKLCVPEHHQSKDDSFLKGGLLPFLCILLLSVFQVMQNEFIVPEGKGITELSYECSDSGREIQASVPCF